MTISNLYKKVDPSWLPFFIPFFTSSRGVEFADFVDYFNSKSTIFPKPIDFFKPFETISVDKVKILMYGSQPSPSPRASAYSYSKNDKQYEVKSETIVRELFQKSICEITPENMYKRNILNINILPFTNTEIFNATDLFYSDNSILKSTIEVQHPAKSRSNDFLDLIVKFHSELIIFIKKTNRNLIILYNSGLMRDSIKTKSYSISSKANISANITQRAFLTSNSSYLNLDSYNSGRTLLHIKGLHGLSSKETLEKITTNHSTFVIDMYAFLFEEELVDSKFEKSGFERLQVMINYIIRKYFKNSNPINW